MAASQQGRMASAALRHPIRIRVLEVLNTRREVSATAFVNERLGNDLEGLKGKTHHQRIADVSYHLRELEKAGCCYLSREVPRRGAVEKFYRANAIAYFSDEAWAELERQERREISRVVAQSLVVQIEGAILADTFDSRTDRWLAWEPMRLDEKGWRELNAAVHAVYTRARQIRRDAEERLDRKDEDAGPIMTTFGVVAFESPDHWDAPPPRTDDE